MRISSCLISHSKWVAVDYESFGLSCVFSLSETSVCWQAMDKWGTIDVLVNNAGISSTGSRFLACQT